MGVATTLAALFLRPDDQLYQNLNEKIKRFSLSGTM